MEKSKNWSSLPSDILVDILSRLAVKSLFRLRGVCKEWYNLISSSFQGSVQDLHSQRSQRNQFLLVWNHPRLYPNGEPQEEDWGRSVTFYMSVVGERIHDDKFEVRISHVPILHVIPCRNLVCFDGFNKTCVCNPSTHQLVELPKSGNIKHARRYIGFGYHPFTKEYKVVSWFDVHNFADGSRRIGCEVFTLTDGGGSVSSGSWRELTRNYFFFCASKRSACVNGVIYLPIYYRKCSLLSFDVEKEKSRIIRGPKSCLSTFDYLLELKGMLCGVESCLQTEPVLKIWMLKDPKNGVWVEAYKILRPHPTDSLVLLAHVPADIYHDEQLVFISHEPKGVLHYDISSRSFGRPTKLAHLSLLGYEQPCLYYDGFFSLRS